jgi:hypothetical protein
MVKVAKSEIQEAASNRKCLICGRVFGRESAAKIHMVKVHVLYMNSQYYFLKENRIHLDWRLLSDTT